MSPKFVGVRLGRNEFEKIENTLKEACQIYSVRVNGYTAASLFDKSMVEATKSFDEMVFTCDIPRFELRIDQRSVLLDYSSSELVSIGIAERISQIMRRKQAMSTRISPPDWGQMVLFLAFSSLLVYKKAMDVFILIIITSVLYSGSVTFLLWRFLFLRNRLSVATEKPKKLSSKAGAQSFFKSTLSNAVGGLAVLMASVVYQYRAEIWKFLSSH